MSGTNDPFQFQGDPNAPSALGQTVGFWQDLARFGGNIAAAANARTASGHLANGTGFGGALGAAIGPTLDQARQAAVTRSNLGLQQQQTRKAGMENQLLSYQLPIAQQSAALTQQFMSDPSAAMRYMNGFYGNQGAAQTAPTDGVGPPGLIGSESGGNPGAVNKSTGASGLAQFTPGRLADLGMYQPPAQGGQWTGQFNIPGFPGVKTYQDFLSNPQAQQAAYSAHMADVQKNIAATPGADKFDPNGLAAVAHLGGVQGMRRFVATNGGYNPNDGRTSLMDYYQKFSGHGAASPASGPRTASAPMAGSGAPQSAATPAPVQVAGPGAPTDTAVASPAPVGVNPNAPVQMPPSTAQGPTLGSAPADGTVAPGMPPSGMPAPQQQAQGPGPMVPGGRAASSQPQGVQPDPAMMAQAQQMEQKAAVLEQQQNFAKMMQARGIMMPAPPGDPAMMRTAAQQFRAVALAGPTAAAQEGAKLPFVGPTERAKLTAEMEIKPTMDRYGNMYLRNPRTGQMDFLGRGSEPKHVFNPQTGNYDWGEVGGLGVGAPGNLVGPRAGGVPGSPGGTAGAGTEGQIAEPGPGQKEMLQVAPKIIQSAIEHDQKVVEDDLSHVIENVAPAKQQLYQLRSLIDQAAPGAAGQFRADFKNWVQTFAPEFVSQVTGDASPAQEFNKIALMGAGKQERGDLGARGGFRAIEMYVKANPNLDMQPTANHDMANALLISHQFHEDYATGAVNHFNNNYDGVINGKASTYQPVKKYDEEFIAKMRPEVYASAISAINGKPYDTWSKGLTGSQLQIVGGILQRADPTAQVNVGDRMVPVSAFTKITGPKDIMGQRNGR